MALDYYQKLRIRTPIRQGSTIYNDCD